MCVEEGFGYKPNTISEPNTIVLKCIVQVVTVGKRFFCLFAFFSVGIL